MRRIMEGMDWGDALQFVAFGNVRALNKPPSQAVLWGLLRMAGLLRMVNTLSIRPFCQRLLLRHTAYLSPRACSYTPVPVSQVGADQVDECQHYVLVAPQNVVGSTISTKLQEMVRALPSCPPLSRIADSWGCWAQCSVGCATDAASAIRQCGSKGMAYKK